MSTASSMPVAAFVLALISLIVATLVLGWNVAQFLLAGGRPKVTFLLGAVTGGGTGLMTWPPEASRARQIEQLAEQGFNPEPVVAVKVTNHGRSPVRVERWSIQEEPSGVIYTPIGDSSIGPDMPYDLPPGANAVWALDMQVVKRVANTSAAALGTPHSTISAKVELGTGRMLRTKGTLRLR